MYESLNDFIHTGAAEMLGDNPTPGKHDYAYYEDVLRRWVQELIENPQQRVVTGYGYSLSRNTWRGQPRWTLNRNKITYIDLENDSNFIHTHK